MPRQFRMMTGSDLKDRLVEKMPHGTSVVLRENSHTVDGATTWTALNVSGSGFFDAIVCFVDTADSDEVGDTDGVFTLKLDGNTVFTGTIYDEFYYPLSQQVTKDLIGIPVCIDFDDANKDWAFMFIPIVPMPFNSALLFTVQNTHASNTFRVGRLRIYYRTT